MRCDQTNARFDEVHLVGEGKLTLRVRLAGGDVWKEAVGLRGPARNRRKTLRRREMIMSKCEAVPDELQEHHHREMKHQQDAMNSPAPRGRLYG
jgi:hypothetical protein